MTLDAPTAWANTPAGSVEAMNNLQITNLTGQVGGSRPGIPAHADHRRQQSPESGDDMGVLRRCSRTGSTARTAGLGKYTVRRGRVGDLRPTADNNGIDSTIYPGPAGLWCVMWDAGNPQYTDSVYASLHRRRAPPPSPSERTCSVFASVWHRHVPRVRRRARLAVPATPISRSS